jgi:lincosamide nucleotidyltransferase A/C/D/E
LRLPPAPSNRVNCVVIIVSTGKDGAALGGTRLPRASLAGYFTLELSVEMVESYSEKVMPAEEVVAIYTLLGKAGVELWVDGGWCVDALLAQQTRAHKDLDVALHWKDTPKLRELLGARGYGEVRRESQWNFVMGNDLGREVDVHAFVCDAHGDVVEGVMYPTGSLSGQGVIGGQQVKCITPEYMVQFISPWLYKLREKDFHDVAALCDKFGIPYPQEYIQFKFS